MVYQEQKEKGPVDDRTPVLYEAFSRVWTLREDY